MAIASEFASVLRDCSWEVREKLFSDCQFCKTNSGVLKSHICHVVSYCSEIHRLQDRPDHRRLCEYVQMSNARINGRWALMSLHSRWYSTTRNIDWLLNGFPDRESYVTETSGLIEVYQRVSTVEAIRGILKFRLTELHFKQERYLAAGAVASTWIRLDEDSEVYQFIKNAYLLNDYSLRASYVKYPKHTCLHGDPFEGGEIFESVRFYTQLPFRIARHAPLLVSLTLLKIKVLLDLQDIQNARMAIGSKFPCELFDKVMGFIFRSSAIKAIRTKIYSQDLSKRIAALSGQIKILYNTIDGRNAYLWRILATGDIGAINDALAHLHLRSDEPPNYPTERSPWEACVWSRELVFSWLEVCGAMEYFKKKNDSIIAPPLKYTEKTYGMRAQRIHKFCTTQSP